MGQMWRPLRHSQTQVILPNTEPIVPKRELPKKSREVARSEQKAVNGVQRENKTFEDHFNQYKSERKEIKGFLKSLEIIFKSIVFRTKRTGN